MELNEEKGDIKAAFGNLVADLRIFGIAFQRLWHNILCVIKCVNFDVHSKLFKWIIAVVVALIALLLLFRSCPGVNEDNADVLEDSISNVVAENPAIEFSTRVERPTVAHRLSNIRYGREFNDLNEKHLAVAKKIGIKPLNTREDAANASRALVDISSENAYKVDELTHSIPYLIPEAAALLKKIAENFQDSLVMKHLPPHKIIVTSVLRTQDDVKRLKKGNRNSTENSVHCYGTTVDISHKRFLSADGETTDNQAKLKLVLGEVLRDLKKQGLCYVKHERKQACFHITVCKAP